MAAPYASVKTGDRPGLTFPRRYNAAADLLDRNVEQGRGGRPAYIEESGTTTYAALRDRANREDDRVYSAAKLFFAFYFNQREKSFATFHGPWTRTVDRHVRDADGYYTYCGRSDDRLKVSGIWVSPFEVESALSAHESVLEAAVVGLADADGLTKPKAFVVLKPGAQRQPQLEDELKAFVNPRWIELVDALPKTATGKIQRYKLRA